MRRAILLALCLCLPLALAVTVKRGPGGSAASEARFRWLIINESLDVGAVPRADSVTGSSIQTSEDSFIDSSRWHATTDGTVSVVRVAIPSAFGSSDGVIFNDDEGCVLEVKRRDADLSATEDVLATFHLGDPSPSLAHDPLVSSGDTAEIVVSTGAVSAGDALQAQLTEPPDGVCPESVANGGALPDEGCECAEGASTDQTNSAANEASLEIVTVVEES